MENWEEILRKENASKAFEQDNRKKVLYDKARRLSNETISQHYQPMARLLRVDEKLQSIRDNVWKAGSLSIVNDLVYYQNSSYNFIGNSRSSSEGYYLRYMHTLSTNGYSLGVGFSGEKSMRIEVVATPSLTGVDGYIKRFEVYTWQTENVAKLPHQFDVALAEYCELMTRKGHLTKSGIVR